METDDLVARLRSGWSGREDQSEAAARIEALEAQLAARDAHWAEKVVQRVDENEALRSHLAARDAEIARLTRIVAMDTLLQIDGVSGAYRRQVDD